MRYNGTMNTLQPIELPSAVLPLIHALENRGIRPIVVGGFVRDALLGIQSKDIDIELFAAHDPEALAQLLSAFGTVDRVGKSFGVYKLRTDDIECDLSLPRTEQKSGTGHRGFTVETFTAFDFAKAARRRDFTVNAIGFDPVRKMVLDPYNGSEDLRNGRLRCVNPATFVDDPLRLFRAIQFAARFHLTPDKQLITLAREMVRSGVLNELPKERIFDEWQKLLLKSDKPSIGFCWMERFGMLTLFPTLHALKGVPVNPLSHGVKDVLAHTLSALDCMAAERSGDAESDLAMMLGILCHDIGKPYATRLQNGIIKAPQHAIIGLDAALTLLTQLTNNKKLHTNVLNYVRYHGEPKRLFEKKASDPEILQLSRQTSIEKIIKISRCDHARQNIADNAGFDIGEWLTQKAERLGVYHHGPEPLLTGRDIIALGMVPSERFKTILDDALDAQIHQKFRTQEEGLAWLKTYLDDLGKS